MIALFALVPLWILAAPPIDTPTDWTPAEMLKVKRIGGVHPSPDGRRVAYTVREAVMDELRSEVVTQIHLADWDGGNPIQLTRGQNSSDNPQWSPDGKQIAFISNRTGRPAVWVIQVSGGEAEQLIDYKTAVTSFRWSSDGKGIAFTAVDPPTLAEEVAARMKADVRIIDEGIKYSRLHLVLLAKDEKGKRPMRTLTTEDINVTPDAFDWSPDNSTIVFAHTRSPKADDWTSSDISLVNVETSKLIPLAVSKAAETEPKFSRDGRWIAFAKSDDPPTWAQHSIIHLISPDGKDIRILSATPDMRPTIFGWSKNNDAILCGEIRGTRSQIYSLPLNGPPRALSNWDGAASAGVNLSLDGTVAGFAWEWPDRAPEAYVTRTDEFKPVVISRVNKMLPKFPLGETEVIRWNSVDGQEIEGLLTYPADYQKGKRYPLLLVIHGGPAGVFIQNFISLPYPYPVAAFASRGYAVLRPNPRGSGGYGKEFRYANYKDWGGRDFQDLMSGVDEVIKLGIADSEKLGVMGWSYGGFMTSWVITQTQRFKAASVGAGVTNLISFTGTADIPSFLPDYFNGEFWVDDQIYRERSPLFRARGVRTPTLIQHGTNDERVPLSQGLEFYNALKRQNSPVKMVVYPRTTHSITEPRLLLDCMQRNLNWVEEHVRGVKSSVAVQVPPTRIDNVKEILHGVEIVDPYRWLEDQQSQETRDWLKAQNKYMRATVDSLPGREVIRQRLSELMNHDTVSTPSIHGGRWFYSRRTIGQEQPVYMYRDGVDGNDVVLLDVNTLSEDRTTSVAPLDTSNDGKLWVYGVRKGGEDEIEVRLRDVESKNDLPFTMPRGRYFGVQCSHDRKGVYYSRMTKVGPRVYFRSFENENEREVFGEGYGTDKIISVRISEQGRFVLITVLHGSAATKTEIYVLRLPNEQLVTIVNDVDARFSGQIGGDTLYMHTNWRAPNNRLIAVDLNQPDQSKWQEIIAEDPKSTMQSFSIVGSRLFANYLANVASKLTVHEPDGRMVGEVNLPGIGTGGVVGHWGEKEAFLTFNNFVTPFTIYHYDIENNVAKNVWFRPLVPIESDNFVVDQVHFRSKDGTEIPMFVVHKKGIKLNGSNPTLLTGYGGFNLSRTPSFASTIALWCEQGGVFALPALRGGGEFGEAWHRAGMLEKKQNVFDDFIAAAEFLIQKKYTRSEKLAIAGGSNGGLLVGAALTQRPDLFSAVLCSVPLLDMVRYHRFLVARFWIPEYGSADDPEQFRFLYSYSPYHRVRKGTRYPSVMFVTGDSDTRVDPLHARKMCALLQATTVSGTERPILLHYDTKAGHSQGKPISKQIDDLVDQYSYLFWQLKVIPE